jgi:hypothetical protein
MNQQGPLVFPIPPPDPECAEAVMNRLTRHSTSDLWLPADTGWAELDAVRAEHLRLRQAVLDEINAHLELTARFAAEDGEHRQAQIEAHRNGRAGSVKDKRTAPEKRDHQLAEIAGRLWSGVLVLADVVDEVIALVREHEPKWLAQLQEQRQPAAEKRREAEKLLHEADVEEFSLAMRADWLKKLVDDGPFGRAPYPQPTPRPKQMGQSRIDAMFERHWSKQDEPPMRSWQEVAGVSDDEVRRLNDEARAQRAEDEDARISSGDQTGVVSELESPGARR